jgi:ferric-dicitrate binding protein FerR (iron transport regulator)
MENNEIADDQLEKYYGQKWDSADVHMDQAQQERLYQKVRNAAAQRPRGVIRSHAFYRVLSYAACLVLGILCTWGVMQYLQGNELSKTYSVITEKGQKTTVILPDGTTVWLNSASRISYDMSYAHSDRNVTLEGEAYFEVAEDKERPFVVHTDDYTVTALGTEFNVYAYKDDNMSVTTLVEGRVQVQSDRISTQLDGEQSISYDRLSGEFVKKNTATAYTSGLWRDNELVVSAGTTLEQLTAILERNYNIQFEFLDETIKNYKFEGIIKNCQLANVLELVCLTAPVEYEIRSNKVVLNAK